MATAKKGILSKAGEWWNHLRKTKRTFWKRERKAVQRAIKKELV